MVNVQKEVKNNNSNAGFWVAIITIVASTLGNAYGAWLNKSSAIEITSLKAELAKESEYSKMQWENYHKQCNSYSVVAGELAQYYGAVIKENDFDKDSDVEAALWKGIMLLPKELQDPIIEEYIQFPKDKFGIMQTYKMVKTTLTGLAVTGRKCHLKITSDT